MTTMTTSPATSTATKTRGPTLAHLKRFVAKHRDSGLMIWVQSRFNGMIDCVDGTGETGFSKADTSGNPAADNLGVSGVWLVGGSRNYITEYRKNGMVGYDVSNCCGSFILAVPEAATVQPTPTATLTPATSTVSPTAVGYTFCQRLTKGGKPFWCAAPSGRVSSEEWFAIRDKCKAFAKGWWHGATAGNKAGWSFWKEEDARAFIASLA